MSSVLTSIKPAHEVPHSIGSIFYRDSRAAYVVAIRERRGASPTATYVYGPRDVATYRLAELELSRRLVDLEDHGKRHVGKVLTVGGWLATWLPLQAQLSGYPVTPGARLTGSYSQYEIRIRRYLIPVLGDVRMHELDADTITAALVKLGTMRGARGELLAPGTVNAAWVTLRAALKDAYDSGKLKRDVTRGVNVATSDTLVEPPTIAELDALWAQLAGEPVMLRAAFAIMRETGARRGEVLGLEWRNNGVDLDMGTIVFRRQRKHGARVELKTRRKSVRRVAIPAYVVALLRAIPRRLDSPLVFHTRTGHALDGRFVLRHFDAAAERAGIAPDPDADLDKYRVHDLRHAFVTTLLEAGVSSAVVMAWTGHSSLKQLDRYNDVHPVRGGEAYRRLVAVWGDDAGRAFGLHMPAGAATVAS